MTDGRILIADDHPLTWEGLSLAARAALPGAAIVPAASVADAVAALEGRSAFRLVLLDFQLPDAHGFSGMLKLQHIRPTVPICVVTAHQDSTLVEAARALGAAGFIPKSLALDAIAAILRHILAGGTHFPATAPAANAIAAARERLDDLSPAQRAVLIAMADGRANKQIAFDLQIGEATVKAHLTAIFRKLGVTNRSQALLAVQPLIQAGSGVPDR
ncbi:response regulator transcription factor [Sphingomonas sp. KR1UV-12]|uniref:Response regulator transcription factor n=1 Tax=Sphingomonas aurea TaxID=3063994 RepID=A0ABT9EFP6_9SPHN|nr:response regulator transcription factor [Sphingomonas sp. KR1UV-12]MDP1025788.1 response regulator transcription factor [Sphingomonas sp. KR1UV-12]